MVHRRISFTRKSFQKQIKDQIVEKTNGLKKTEKKIEKVGLAEPVNTNEIEDLIDKM